MPSAFDQKEVHGAGVECALNSVNTKKLTGNNNWKNFLNSVVVEKDPSHQASTDSIANKKKHEIISQKGVNSLTTEIETISFKNENKKLRGNGDAIGNDNNNIDSTTTDPSLVPYKPIKASKVKSRCIAIDCEMVGGGPDGQTDILARVSLVNSSGTCIYDTFVKSTKPVVDYRTFVSGVREGDMQKGKLYKTVQTDVLNLIKGKILVGHSIHSDLKVLKIWHPAHLTRDTSRFKKFREITTRTPGLKLLTSHFLNVNIQDGEHSSIVDAQAAMQLYMMFREEWEAEVKSKRPAHIHVKKESGKPRKPSHRPKRMHKNYKK